MTPPRGREDCQCQKPAWQAGVTEEPGRGSHLHTRQGRKLDAAAACSTWRCTSGRPGLFGQLSHPEGKVSGDMVEANYGGTGPELGGGVLY